MAEDPQSHPNEERSAPRGRLRVVRRRAESSTSLEAPRVAMEIGALELELGGRLENVTAAYRTWGRLNEAADNAVVVLHALTGDSLAAGPGGWWDPLIGPGRASTPTARSFSAPTFSAAARAPLGPRRMTR